MSNQVVFREWVMDYSDELLSWAYYKTSSRETAEDLVQDTFAAAYHKMDAFEGKSKPKTWLFSILNNKIIDYYRKKSKNSITSVEHEKLANATIEGLFTTSGHWNPEYAVDEDNWLDNPEFNTILSDCIEDLPANWQYAIRSRYIENHKSKMICETLDITQANYWQIVHRAKLALRQCLEKKWVNE